MTNYEKNKTIIDEIWEAESTIAISKGEIRSCSDTKCKECLFSGHSHCSIPMAQWLMSEYKEPQTDWSKVPVDTPILVRDNEDCIWQRRYFAKYENGKVYTWADGRTSWSAFSQDDCLHWDYAKLAEE